MIPGMNLLTMALQVIASATVTYYKNASRTTNAIGLDVSAYDAGVPIQGSVQSIERRYYQDMGLDFEKNYKTLYTTTDVVPIGRNVSGDQFEYDGGRYQCLYITDWRAQDGWVAVMAVEITNA